jgi:hypothetical protein
MHNSINNAGQKKKKQNQIKWFCFLFAGICCIMAKKEMPGGISKTQTLKPE